MHAVLLLAAALGLTGAASPEKKIICYYASGMLHSVNFIDPSLCTHLIYQHVEFRNGDIEVFRPNYDLPDNWGQDGYGRFNALRHKNPYIKTMISFYPQIKQNCTVYSKMLSDSASRENFVNNIVKFVKKWGFNGLDMDWSCHQQNATIPYMENGTELLGALRTRFNREGLVLSAVVGANEDHPVGSYDISHITEYVDFVNFVTFNFHDNWDGRTGIDAPLQIRYNSSGDKALSVEASVVHWLSRGVPRDKLIVGISTLGKSRLLVDANENGIGAAVKDYGYYSSGVFPDGLPYHDICRIQKMTGGWTVVFDEERRAPFTFKENQWITYENIKSVREKAEFTARLNLGGVWLSGVHHDDYNGLCGEKYPILKMLNAVLRNGNPVPEYRSTIESRGQCVQSGYTHDPNSCGVIACTSDTTGGYHKHRFECTPGNCHNAVVGKIRAETVDYNFFICDD